MLIKSFFLDKPLIQIEGQREYTTLVGESVSIRATVSGVPGPIVTWRFNDQNLMTDENLKIATNGNIHEIRIFKSDFSNTGTYQITAENTVGQDQKTVTLKVQG